MRKFELLALKCRMCDWQWETTPQDKAENILCEQCGSNDIFIEKQNLQMLKKNGKFLTDIGFNSGEELFVLNEFEDFSEKFDKPLIVIKEDDFRLPLEMSDNDRISLLGRIDTIRSQLLQDIRESKNSSFINLE